MKTSWGKFAFPALLFAVGLAGLASFPPAKSEPTVTADRTIAPLCDAIAQYYESRLDCILTQSKAMLLVWDFGQRASVFRREDVVNALCLESSMDAKIGYYNFEEAVGCLVRTDMLTASQVYDFYASIKMEGGGL